MNHADSPENTGQARASDCDPGLRLRSDGRNYADCGRRPAFKQHEIGDTMRYFLAKTDPDTYSIDDLERDGSTVWDGVRNAQAVAAIRTMAPGDRVLIYHSQGQAGIVGLAEVISAPRPDPSEAKSWVVDVRFLRRVDPPISLRAIKDTHQFDDWSLIRQGRLSTMAVPDSFIAWLQARGALD
jgi:predicted RNA-binding protein with PUA-like domain